ncbi:MAG TPA: 4Fe-4S dicluster domain-containing protein [Deltaproteobacteria bacterium]|nr:4Fe-4S dicluster domain-containing protein [Deltaproteobacteria bacterium]
MDSIYIRLRERLDELASGYPETGNGIELRVLEDLFSLEDAELFLNMGLYPETAAQVAARLGQETESTAGKLEDLALRGLLFRFRLGHSVSYQIVPFIVGIYEFQVNNLNPRLLKDLSKYYLGGLGKSFHDQKTPHLRTIPVNEEVASGLPITRYENASEIIQSKDTIAIADCLCRKAVRAYGGGCGNPLETCMQFDSFAQYYVDNKMARSISTDEAMHILARNQEAGLVLQTINSKTVEAMCACCSCCCGMLISLKLYPSPARAVKSNYVCRVETEECTGCGTCTARCPVDAITLIEEKAEINQDRCIGCGLCVSTCPARAHSLMMKHPDKLYTPPETAFDAFMDMSRERGKL